MARKFITLDEIIVKCKSCGEEFMLFRNCYFPKEKLLNDLLITDLCYLVVACPYCDWRERLIDRDDFNSMIFSYKIKNKDVEYNDNTITKVVYIGDDPKADNLIRGKIYKAEKGIFDIKTLELLDENFRLTNTFKKSKGRKIMGGYVVINENGKKRCYSFRKFDEI